MPLTREVIRKSPDAVACSTYLRREEICQQKDAFALARRHTETLPRVSLPSLSRCAHAPTARAYRRTTQIRTLGPLPIERLEADGVMLTMLEPLRWDLNHHFEGQFRRSTLI